MSLRLVPISLAAFRALAEGDVSTAERLTGLRMTEWFAERTYIWDYMVSLLEDRPANADWLMQAVVLGDDAVIGNAGFKGRPKGGQVELGYSIDPRHRRRGHASVTGGLLLDRAGRDPEIDRVIARINPTNTASLAVVARAGFVPDGDYLSPRSGHQLQHARATPTPPA